MTSRHKPDALADFPVVVVLPIQWGDQDAKHWMVMKIDRTYTTYTTYTISGTGLCLLKKV